MINRILTAGEVIDSYGSSGEHFTSHVSYSRYQEFQLLSAEDRNIYSGNYELYYYIFRNDSLLAALTEGIDDYYIYKETIVESRNGKATQNTRSLNPGFVYSENGFYDNSKIKDSVAHILFKRVYPVDYYPENINVLIAKFDPRFKEQELLREQELESEVEFSEEDQKAIASRDSIYSLTHLNFENKNLSEVPGSVMSSEVVTHIKLNMNYFTTFPVEFKQVKNLISLDLSDNQFSMIPASIIKFENLEALYLDNNKLATLPSEVTKLENLKYLSLAGNNFSSQKQNEIRSWFTKKKCIVFF